MYHYLDLLVLIYKHNLLFFKHHILFQLDYVNNIFNHSQKIFCQILLTDNLNFHNIICAILKSHQVRINYIHYCIDSDEDIILNLINLLCLEDF